MRIWSSPFAHVARTSPEALVARESVPELASRQAAPRLLRNAQRAHEGAADALGLVMEAVAQPQGQGQL